MRPPVQIELGQVRRLVIAEQDRFVRFGYDWFEAFCQRRGTEITVINGGRSRQKKNWCGT